MSPLQGGGLAEQTSVFLADKLHSCLYWGDLRVSCSSPFYSPATKTHLNVLTFQLRDCFLFFFFFLEIVFFTVSFGCLMCLCIVNLCTEVDAAEKCSFCSHKDLLGFFLICQHLKF